MTTKSPKIQASKLMKEIMGMHYLTVKNARFNGQPLAWITSGFPVEILYAMDVVAVYPENHAAMCGIQRMAPELQQVAEDLGYSRDLCSYARTDIGQMVTGRSPIMGLPEPDFILSCNNICSTVVKWYEVVARHYGVPHFVLDTPFIHGSMDEAAVRYVVEQLSELVTFLEERTGRTFDQERFTEVLTLAARAVELWDGVLSACEAVPSPMSCFDAFIHMGPIVTLRGRQECVDYYETLHEEITARVRDGIAAVEGERVRLMWDNLPIWFNMRTMSGWLAERGVCLVAATYPSSWTAAIDPDASGDPMAELARVYLSPFINSGLERRLTMFSEMIERFKADGFILHSNRSCKPYSLGQYRFRDMVTQATGRQGIVIEGDMTDPRLYAEGPTITRLEAYLESMEARA